MQRKQGETSQNPNWWLLYFAVYSVLLCVHYAHPRLCASYTGVLYLWRVIIIPMCNAHPYLSIQFGQKLCVIHGKIQYLREG